MTKLLECEWVPWLIAALFAGLFVGELVLFTRATERLTAVADESYRLAGESLETGRRCMWTIVDMEHTVESFAWPRPVFLPMDLFSQTYRENMLEDDGGGS